MSADSYDDIPYDSTPFAETHPDYLYVLGRLFGLETTPPQGARILELGCATGGNIIPLAYYMPQAQVVGIELSAGQVATAQELIKQLGLTNIEIRQGDIMQLGPELGQFDYIIAHGVYSWVPDFVREKILALCRTLLSEHGIAYISFNTLPGWRMRGMLRDMLLHHARHETTPRARLMKAYEFMEFMDSAVTGLDALSARYLAQEIASLRKAHPSYIYHEYMESINQPFLFSEFMDDAHRHQLQYLCDVELATMFPSTLGENVETLLEPFDNALELEQYMDFVRNRNFRRTLLCREERSLNRELSLEQIDAFLFYSQLSPPKNVDLSRVKEQDFVAADGQTYSISHPLTKAALLHLGAIFPAAASLGELQHHASAIATARGGRKFAEQFDHMFGELFSLFAHGGLRLTSQQMPPLAATLPERPQLNPLARSQSALGYGHLATQRHGTIQLDAFATRLVRLLDGGHSPGETVEQLVREIESGELTVPSDGKQPDRAKLTATVSANVQRLLGVFARQGLLQERQ